MSEASRPTKRPIRMEVKLRYRNLRNIMRISVPWSP